MAENIKVRKFGLIGIASPIIGLLAVLVSIYFSPWFEWPTHALSDLGVEQEGRLISQFAQEGDTQIATWTFNGGMIVAGLLIAIFVSSTRKTIPDNLMNKIAYSLIFIGGINLALVGVFPYSVSETIHLIVALIYFIFTPIGLIMIGVERRTRDKNFAIFSIGSGIVSLVVIGGAVLGILGTPIGTIYPEGVAIPEFIEAVILGLWIGIAGIRVFKTGKF
tara:strand:+ start:291 stop:950 length:660 start_codon:yes stop_codon:yes gene_type:complete